MTRTKRTHGPAWAWVAGSLLTAAPALLLSQSPPPNPPLPPTPPSSTTIFPLDQVRPGLEGVAYTVFQGVTPEPMAVHILGRLKNALGPGRDMILARLEGTKPEYTGVVAGMSGSPVYIDGKLLGALSFRIGQFSKEPIAGITPIALMLEVQRGATQPATQTEQPTFAGLPDIRPMEEPLVFSGFGSEALARFGDGFRKLGLEPVAGLGSMDPEQKQAAPLEPGSAVSAVLVEGDLSITGTCTVSYLDKDRLMACGHPITQAGEISLPMAKAEVLATLPSPMNSFKIVNATEVVGAFTEDRSSAIFGRLGVHARMIPVHIALHSSDPQIDKDIDIRIADQRELTPQLMLVSLFQSLQEVETAAAEASYHLTGELTLARREPNGSIGASLPPVHVDTWAAPANTGPGSVAAALDIGTRFSDLYSNPLEQPIVTGVHLHVVATQQRQSAEIESAHLLTPEVGVGGVVQLEVVVRPYQKPPEVLRETVALPASVNKGTVRLLVSDGATVDHLLAPPSTHDVGLDDTIARLNAEHPNDRVYLTLLNKTAQAVLDSATLTEVPLSVANVLDPLKNSQRIRLNGESITPLSSHQLPDEVSGSQILQLTIR